MGGDWTSWVRAGLDHAAAEQPAAAVVAFRRAAALAPGRSEIWISLAKLAYDAAALDATVTFGRRALACDAASLAGAIVGAALVAADRWREALPLLDAALGLQHGPAAAHEPRTSFAKLKHDAEQIEHLVGLGRLAPAMAATAAGYRALLPLIPKDGNPAVVLEGEARRRLAPAYNRLLYRDAGAEVDGPAVNPGLDGAGIESAYLASLPQVAVIDDLLTPAALEAVLRYCRDSTVWFAGDYAGGYVGAQMGDGFAAPILFQIAAELKALLPAVIGEAGLHHLWAFKYDSGFSGINLHADAARINVNFWITPDEANLDPTSGGLEIFDSSAPVDWNFAAYNSDAAAIARHLEAAGARSVVVPHRQNRAVLFDSDLFHRTDVCRFRDGYLNRRINITMLYGTRQPAGGRT